MRENVLLGYCRVGIQAHFLLKGQASGAWGEWLGCSFRAKGIQPCDQMSSRGRDEGGDVDSWPCCSSQLTD